MVLNSIQSLIVIRSIFSAGDTKMSPFRGISVKLEPQVGALPCDTRPGLALGCLCMEEIEKPLTISYRKRM